MATKEHNSPQNDSNKSQGTTPASLADDVQNLHLETTPQDTDNSNNDAPRPVFVYTHRQLLNMSKSPLVTPPANMPNLVQWLGPGDSETSIKKDTDSSASNAPRDRRFRRDNEEGDAPLRPSFRSSLSQPSQMGNFKHQSLRATERDRDRDDHNKDTNERLRNLSDKFDRERLNLPANGTRNKDRDSAPHLPSGTGRVSTQNNGTTKRSEQREGSKKKLGESSEDWRKGADPSRPGRDDKREDRERARSRPRDTSRTRREPSPTRRDRDDADRDRYRRVDRDRDEYRKEREAYRREREREEENDDPRRWRDDGRRDERLANTRRDRATDRDRDPNQDDRRWTVVEDRDARSKRNGGRERRQPEEGREREDRKDREREREKEKEPAWMDSTVPTTGGTGIIGGRTADGELDQIQAWKKSVKEREQKEKEKTTGKNSKGKADTEPPAELPLAVSDPAAPQLDEIQLFKLIMKKENEKKKTESPSDSPALPPAPHPTLAPTTESESNAKSASDPRDLLAMLAGTTLPTTTDAMTDKGGKTTPLENTSTSTTPQIPQFQPPAGSRLLAMRNPSTQTVPMAKSPVGVLPGSPGFTDPHSHSPVSSAGGFPGGSISQPKPQVSKIDMMRQQQQQQGFSPFDEQSRLVLGLEDPQIAHDVLRRPPGSLMNESELMALEHANGNHFGGNRGGGGSRFAKFFDKPREPELAVGGGGGLKSQNVTGYPGSVAGLHQRPDGSFGPSGMMHSNSGGSVGEQRSIEDIYAMLNNSAQNRGGPMHTNAPIRPSQSPSLHLIQQQQILHQQQQQQQQLLNANRLDALYDSRLDDRNFVPDGMVPGLRTAPPPRRRNDGLDVLEEQMGFNLRHAANPQQQQQQQRAALEQLYNGTVPGHYGQPMGGGVGRNPGLGLQQAPPFRGGPSPINHNGLHNPQQRLPPGLANLGGRPPHEPMMHNGMLPPPQQQPPVQQGFNQYSPNNFRGPVGHNMNPLGNQGLNHQLQGMVGNGRFSSPPIQGGTGGFPMRQPPSMMGPPQHQIQQPQAPPQGFGSTANQPAHELMALLMGGQPRE